MVGLGNILYVKTVFSWGISSLFRTFVETHYVDGGLSPGPSGCSRIACLETIRQIKELDLSPTLPDAKGPAM